MFNRESCEGTADTGRTAQQCVRKIKEIKNMEKKK